MVLVVIKVLMMRVVVINQHDDGDGCGGQHVQPGDQHVVLADQVLDLLRPRIPELFPLGLQLDKLSVLCTESKERALDLHEDGQSNAESEYSPPEDSSRHSDGILRWRGCHRTGCARIDSFRSTLEEDSRVGE